MHSTIQRTAELTLAVSWGDRPKRVLAALVACFALLATTPANPLTPEAAPRISVIVRELPGFAGDLRGLVKDLGGRVGVGLGIIDAFEADLPPAAIESLSGAPGVHSVTPNGSVQLLGKGRAYHGKDESLGSMFSVAQEVTGAAEMWDDGITGRGVDVALIDSGVAPVDGMNVPGKVVNGADLSFESQSDDLRYLDSYGHGTHMAGIIAGRDDSAPAVVQKGDSSNFLGMAPDARILNVKVADANGATDVSQVIAAIDWVVKHRRDEGLNVRVLNLSFGTDGTQDYLLDPLAYAAEVAWRKGIVVVVAAGNGGFGSAKLNNPAYDPYVLAVGAADGNGTYDIEDDTIPNFSSCGNEGRHPDLVAPGKSIVSLRVPGSSADDEYPKARVGDRFFRGSGTSQAAAVVSGAAALIIDQRPDITPDRVKALLTSSASPLPKAAPACQGAGMVNLEVARDFATPASVQSWPPSTGTGSLELARGSAHVVDDASGGPEEDHGKGKGKGQQIPLTGEIDIFGNAWDGATWSAKSWSESSWSAGVWNGNLWSGDSWSGTSWAGKSWSATEWAAKSWSGQNWSAKSWSAKSWSGKSWSGKSWSGKSWSGKSWSSDAWSSEGWGD
jgi:hypothetical protein